jgi:hypothetical protein
MDDIRIMTTRSTYTATSIEIYSVTPRESMNIILISSTPYTMCPMITLQWESAIKLMRLMGHPRTRTIHLDDRFQFTVLSTMAIPMPNGNFRVISTEL